MSSLVNSINTLSEFLLESGSKYRIFDMGRRVTKISSSVFDKFENALTPYPYPSQQHAFIAVVFWNKQKNEANSDVSNNQQYVWFLKLPLDEKGLLEQASRSQFLDLVIQALGRSLEKTPSKEQQSALDHNPIIFKPSEQKLASFTSQVRHTMKLAPSEFMGSALDYLLDKKSYSNWENVGYQGLCDITVRLSDPLFNQAINNALPHLPKESFCALCCALENIELNSNISETLLNILRSSIDKNDTIAIIHTARALSNAKGEGFTKQAFEMLMSYQASEADALDVLVIISGRYWLSIQDNISALMYLEKAVSLNIEQDIFNQLFSDLVFIPACRDAMLFVLQTQHRSELLSQYFTNFLITQG